MILAGDVGATKTLLGLFRRRSGGAAPIREAALPTADHASSAALLEEFASDDLRRVKHVVLGVAGPVADNLAAQINLPWPVDGRKIERQMGVPVTLLNDVEAMGWGISRLPPSKLRNLTRGKRRRDGDGALIAAGTGLGMLRLRRRGDGFEPLAGEGGHQGFAPRDDLDVALFRSLRRRHDHVSLERILSGQGLATLYSFLLEHGWDETCPTDVRAIDAAADRAAAIASAAAAGDRLAERAVEWFVSLYGAAAGDLALHSNAVAGVFVGGGIAIHLLPFLAGGGFMEAFVDKGRLRPLVEKIPVRVILEPRVALLGAAAYATDLKATRAAAARRGPRKKK